MVDFVLKYRGEVSKIFGVILGKSWRSFKNDRFSNLSLFITVSVILVILYQYTLTKRKAHKVSHLEIGRINNGVIVTEI